jgi:outer membrane protein assembly factor BamA
VIAKVGALALPLRLMYFRTFRPNFTWPIVFFLAFFQAANAQVISPVDSSKLASPPGIARIDTLAVDSAIYVIRSISFSGNRTTKPFIMERELTFHAGDTLTGAQLKEQAQQSKRNLLNTSLFNFVTVAPYCSRDSVEPPCSQTDIIVTVKERWYTWPAPIFEVTEQNFNTWWRNGHNFQRASYGFYLWRYNFRGRKESIALICRFGYAQQFGGQYAIPYVNKKQTLGVTFTGTYTRSHEVSYATQENKLLFYKDRDNFIRTEVAGSVMLTYRQGFYIRHTLDFRYTDLQVKDTVLDLSEDYFAAGLERMKYFSLSYRITRDYRDIRAYPLRGHFEELEITKHGFGILPGEKLDFFFLVAGFRQYLRLAPRVYGAYMIRARWLPGATPPYYHQRALGFGNLVRGYEYYVIDGQSYVLGKVSLRYQLLKPHVYRFDFLPVEKFNTFHLAIYTGLFADAGYTDDRASNPADRNKLGNTLLFGYGAGIDIVTYYDVALRIEYSFNRIGESGFFLHLGAAF